MAGAGAFRGAAAAAVLSGRRQVQLCVLLCWLWAAVSGQIQYSVPEEMQRGAIVGNIAKDLGLNTRELSDRKLRVVSPAGDEYFTLNAEAGTLHVKGRIDRDEMCGGSPSCSITFQVVAENPLNIYHVEVLIHDINDNAPSFPANSIDLDIVETTLPGTRFTLGNARDPDIGSNSLQGYELSPNPHFVLERKSASGSMSAELVLKNILDRETQSHHRLTLTASDGGEPIRSSTVDININVLDANDNFPVFSQESYRASISEGAPNNTAVLQVRATDSDEGTNAQITYAFSAMSNSALHVFSLDSKTGKIQIKQPLDFEKDNSYEITLEARDGGGLVSHCEVLIEVTDENDNAPELIFTSITTAVPEDSPPGTVIALINANDRDSGENGEVACRIQEHLPFSLIALPLNYYKLVTANGLDRETAPEYNITVTATDKGPSPLFTSKTIRLQISDKNDNTPLFENTSFKVYISENVPPGTSIYQVKAQDLDLDQNARITYSLSNNHTETDPFLLYTSINPRTGVIYAQRSYDYEQLKEFQFQVKAQDSGSPPLSSNVTVKVFIVDQNDNTPEILYPAVGADGSVPFEMVPQSSAQGYLVTKVVAVDADSGHNAWLSYHLLQVTEQSLFEIGLHTGEIRTSRAFLEKDVMKHKAVVLVKDNGQPPRSATVTLNLVFSDDLQEALPEISNIPLDVNDQSSLEVYLVVALALISLLFILTLMVVVVLKCRKHKSALVFDSLAPALYSHVDPRFTSNYQNGTLPLPLSYELAVALDSGGNEFTLLKPRQEVPTDILISAHDSGIGNESLGEALSSEGGLKQDSNPFL